MPKQLLVGAEMRNSGKLFKNPCFFSVRLCGGSKDNEKEITNGNKKKKNTKQGAAWINESRKSVDFNMKFHATSLALTLSLSSARFPRQKKKKGKRSLIENYRNMVVTQLFHVITKPKKRERGVARAWQGGGKK